MIKCEKCGKELKNRKAYAGHMWLAHLIRVGEKEKMRQRIRELEEKLEKGMSFEAGNCNICGKPLKWHLPEDLEKIKKLVAKGVGNEWFHVSCKNKMRSLGRR